MNIYPTAQVVYIGPQLCIHCGSPNIKVDVYSPCIIESHCMMCTRPVTVSDEGRKELLDSVYPEINVKRG
jgi:hypothetical protein